MAVQRDISTTDLQVFCSQLLVNLSDSILDFNQKDPAFKQGKTLEAILTNRSTSFRAVSNPFNVRGNQRQKEVHILYKELDCIEDAGDCNVDVCATGEVEIEPLKRDRVVIDKCASAQFTFDKKAILDTCEMTSQGQLTKNAFEAYNLTRKSRSIVKKINDDAVRALLANAGNYLNGDNSITNTINVPILKTDGSPQNRTWGAFARYIEKTGFDLSEFYIIGGEMIGDLQFTLNSQRGLSENGRDLSYGIPTLIYDQTFDAIAGGTESKMIVVHRDAFHFLEWFKYADYVDNPFTGRQYESMSENSETFKARVSEIPGTNMRFDLAMKADHCEHFKMTTTIQKHYEFYTLPENCKNLNGIWLFNAVCEPEDCTTTNIFKGIE